MTPAAKEEIRIALAASQESLRKAWAYRWPSVADQNIDSNEWALLAHPRANRKVLARNLRRFADELWLQTELDGCQP